MGTRGRIPAAISMVALEKARVFGVNPAASIHIPVIVEVGIPTYTTLPIVLLLPGMLPEPGKDFCAGRAWLPARPVRYVGKLA